MLRQSYIMPLMALLLLFPTVLAEEKENPSTPREEKIAKIANEQDELQADVQELVAEQTNENVIIELEECQEAMNEVIDNLEIQDTGGKTIAAQTEVIEKVFKAAEKKSESNGNGSMQGMLEMMKGMMGESSGDSDNDKEEGASKNTPGVGGPGESDKNTPSATAGNKEGEKKTQRRLPKSTGNAGVEYPREFSQAMEAYNKELMRNSEKKDESPENDS